MKRIHIQIPTQYLDLETIYVKHFDVILKTMTKTQFAARTRTDPNANSGKDRATLTVNVLVA